MRVNSSGINLSCECSIYKIKQRTIEEKLISCSGYGAEARRRRGGRFVRDTSLSSLTDYFLDSVKKGIRSFFTLNSADERAPETFPSELIVT